MAKAELGNNDCMKVMEVVGEYIFETHKFPQITDVSKLLGIPKAKCRKMCKQLIAQKQLYPVFDGSKLPTVLLPYDMMQDILRMQSKPNWIATYSSKEKEKIELKIKELGEQITIYEQFERLLYTTSIPLEESVAFTLDWLGFDNVHHFKEDTDNPDITFDYENIKALVEVEGTTKAGDKKKVQQLDGWITREIEQLNKKKDELQGIFIVNHFREIEPERRSEPLTPHAKEFLKLYQCRFFTTSFLSKIVNKVMNGSSSKEKARAIIWEGEKIE